MKINRVRQEAGAGEGMKRLLFWTGAVRKQCGIFLYQPKGFRPGARWQESGSVGAFPAVVASSFFSVDYKIGWSRL
jgi:hypothetical protein